MTGEKQIIIAIGSNYNPRHNLSHAEMILRKHFPNIIFSKPMHTTPIGIVSPDFINRIALCSTAEPLDMILKDIKQMEQTCGNTDRLRRQGIVVIDIDILKYGDKKMHIDDWQRPYIQQLLKEMNLI